MPSASAWPTSSRPVMSACSPPTRRLAPYAWPWQKRRAAPSFQPTRPVIISLCDDSQDVADLAAQRVADLLHDSPRAVLGLPTGRTPILLYDQLAEQHAAGALDFSQVTTFNLDEFVG